MKKIIILLVVIVVASSFYFVFSKKQSAVVNDYKNIEYTFSGQPIKLVNGVSEVPVATGSASKIVTKYFGNEVKKDIDGDGREDIVFLMTQNSGGSGTFFYAVGALNKENGYVGTHAVFIGDRIAPQTTESGTGKIVVINYADRAPGEPFTANPTQGKSLQILLDPATLQFGEVVQNFEGEADPSKMTLTMKKWSWIKTTLNDGRIISPKITNKFTLEFKSDKTFSASTDCNGVGGEYSTNAGKISFTSMMSTLMYCEGSQEAEFRKFLEDSTGFHFTSKGELVLDLKFDSGSVVFR